MFERWLESKLATIDDLAQRQLIERFARWHWIHKLRSRARKGPIPTGAFLNAKQCTTVAIQFLAWLADRGRDLAAASQHDVDAWFGSGPSTRAHAARLLFWAWDQRIIHGIDTPRRDNGNSIPMGQQERLDHLHRVLHDDELHIAHRIVAVLVLLFGQPLSKIVRLRRDDVTVYGDHVTLRLAGKPLDLPGPVADLMTQFLADPRFRCNTAANADSPWLFPGTKPGRPLHVYSAIGMMRSTGIAVRDARSGAWLQLVREGPPAVIAEALGVHPNTAMRYAALAGTDYLRYPT